MTGGQQAGPALSIGDIGGRLECHLLEGRREAPLGARRS